jgi:RNA polymerase sigma-70 factor (ECF subfamily)
MADQDWLAGRFEEHRAHLRGVAHKMLGSRAEADEVVQEAWLRLSRSDADGVENLRGWLTTVVAHMCLNVLQSRTIRREDAGAEVPERASSDEARGDPEQELLLADSVGPALLVVLDTLSPAERVAFVLHDLFGVSFDEIGSVVGRSAAATRQLASRARRSLRGADVPEADRTRQREVVGAFLAASRNGDFDALLALLDPEVVVRSDDAALALRARSGVSEGPGAAKELRGAMAVATAFFGQARGAQLALLNGVVGAVWAPGDHPTVAFHFTVADGRIVRIDLIADRARLDELDVEILEPK